MDEFHPILTTDYFEYGTSANHLDQEGAGVEMGDAALGLACSELQHPPKWAVVRNMSDPVINGDLPADEFRLNEQTTWAVGVLHGVRPLHEHHEFARVVGDHRRVSTVDSDRRVFVLRPNASSHAVEGTRS